MEKLLHILKKNRPTSIIVHNNPDPDSLASAMGLRFLLKKKGYKRVRIYYDGLVGRAENQAMIRILRISLFKTKSISSPKGRQYVLVDCQPYTGNVTLPEKISPAAAIDHHPLQKKTSQLPFHDVRPDYGACSTIIYEYFNSLDMSIPRNIATALFHAVFSETQNLGREGDRADKKAYLELLSQLSFSQLSRIQYPSISKEFVSNMFRVLLNTFYYKNLTGVILDQLPYPDFVAEMADFLLRIRKMTWSICLGSYDDLLYISLRTKNTRANASRMIKKIIPSYGTAGGHDMIAGAQVNIDKKNRKEIMAIKKDVVRKMLKQLNYHRVRNLFRVVNNEEFHLL
ncbi:MAG: DHH family phosphoesterase [Candidatus Aminicenantes bacterium]